jgi:hypothetical protein
MTVYSVSAMRPYVFEPALKLLPPDANPVGFITSDDPETSLWRPFGSRKILHVRVLDTGEQIRQRGIRFILARADLFEDFGIARDKWLEQNNAEIINQINLQIRANHPPYEWLAIRMR